MTAAEPATRRARRVRLRTVVFGLALLAISVMAGLSIVTDVTVDGVAVALALLIGAGLALVVGGLASAVRESRRATAPGRAPDTP
jgi:ABC-type nickel/cobalt efflux system permease component RcnA